MTLLTPSDLEKKISQAYANRELLTQKDTRDAVEQAIALLDSGELRVAEPSTNPGEPWLVHVWIKQAILLYFGMRALSVMEVGGLEFYDKIPVKRGWEAAGVRVVPPAVARYGSFVARGAVLMPSYVNIGAYVGEGTMVDTWATVGSCAQIGAHVHLSGGVGIGGVLEPPQAAPVIVEDGCFLGSRAIVVEGVHLEREAVLAANVTLTASTPIIDVSGAEPVTHKGRVPARAVVVPGVRAKRVPSGEIQLACAYILGYRSASTDRKVSLNDALRTFDVPV